MHKHKTDEYLKARYAMETIERASSLVKQNINSINYRLQSLDR